MRRSILLIISCLLAFGASAQPIITQFMNLDIGDKFWMKPAGTQINTSMITVGPNQIWDFSNLPTTEQSIASICIEPSSTPYADSVEVKNSNMAIKTYEADSDTIILYQFLRLGDTNQESMAMGMYHNYDMVSVNYTKWLDPFIGMKVPMSYGDSYNDRQILRLYNIALNEPIVRDTSEITVAVVGYGTVKTPSGTFKNALLFKETINWTWWNNYGQEIYRTQGTDINYMWRVPGLKIGVLSVCIPDGQGGNVSYLWKTEIKSGGMDNPDNNGNENGNGNGNGGNDDPYDPSGIWLNTLCSAGEYFVKNNGSLSWTLGEAITETMDVNPKLTQGFNQPSDFSVFVNKEEMKSEIKVYPNPFSSDVTIDFQSFKNPVNALVYSSTGQLLKTFKVEGPRTYLNLSNYKSGIYYIRIMADEGPKSYVVVKK